MSGRSVWKSTGSGLEDVGINVFDAVVVDDVVFLVDDSVGSGMKERRRLLQLLWLLLKW